MCAGFINMEWIFVLAVLAATGDCVYLRIQEMEINVTESDVRTGVEVTRLTPVTYFGEDLEPRSRADYSISATYFYTNKKCSCLEIDEEGRVLFYVVPKVNSTIKATARVHYQGITDTTIIMINIVGKKAAPACLIPTVNDCFSGNYKFKVMKEHRDITVRDELLGPITTSSECFKANYKLGKTGRFKLDGRDLFLLRGSDIIPQAKVKCFINNKDNTTMTFTRTFNVQLQTSASLPYPLNLTRTILFNKNDFKKSGRLLLSWYWLPEGSNNGNRHFDITPFKGDVTIESVVYNTINIKTTLILMYLEWKHAEEVPPFIKMSLKVNIINKKLSEFIIEPTSIQVKHTVILKMNNSIPTVNYSTDSLRVSDQMAPFLSLASPEGVKNLSNSSMVFKSKMPEFIQSPFGVTDKGGIVYLKSWGAQVFPCAESCPPLFIIEWTTSLNSRVILGVKIFRTVEEKKTSVGRCKEQDKSGSHWFTCASHEDRKSCTKNCGIGALNSSHCSWREARPPIRSTSSPNEVVPTPITPSLTTEYATCRSHPVTCPDNWCDPLEQLESRICPQDCTTEVPGGNINSVTKQGIFSTSFQSICTCTPKCSCNPYIPSKANKTPRNNSGSRINESTTTSSVSTKDSYSIVPTSQHEFELYRTNTEYCDLTCKAVVTFSSFIIFIFIITLVTFRRRCFGKMKTDGGDDGTLSIDPLVPLQTLSTSPTAITESPTIEQTEIDTKWEIPRSRIEILETLGEGEFGKVLKAKAKDLPSKQGVTMVAVKTLKENAGTLEFNDLMSEYSLLKEVNHPNVIKLLGACTTSEGPIYIVIEFCSLGSLRNYLRKSRNAKAHECLEAGSSIEVTPKDILSFSWQICKGMAYLAEMKMVHRDLATRNILLAENKKCKISDFGMTRDVYVDDTYLKVSRSRVPVKWMALESLREHIYTSKSDVWSLGVVLWELVTLGSSPYPGIPAEKLYGLLTSGYRMPRPSNCSIRLYEIMRECWAKEPFRRPNFAQLTNKFEVMLGEDIEYLNCNIHAFSNPAYFNSKPNTSMNNLDIRFSMSLDDLKSTNINNGGFNLYENELTPNIANYDIPKPISPNTYVQCKKIKDKKIDEKVDNR